jgi:hypothetical protein
LLCAAFARGIGNLKWASADLGQGFRAVTDGTFVWRSLATLGQK